LATEAEEVEPSSNAGFFFCERV